MCGGNHMYIEHIAMYANELKRTRDLFIKYFSATSNEGYHNKKQVFVLVF